MPCPVNRSYSHETAVGVCDRCGSFVQFASGQDSAQCGCGSRTNRTCAGAVSPTSQQHGYRVGEYVTPKHPR
jgi:hypothetical protein